MGVEKVSTDELNAVKESMGIKPLEPVDNRTEEEKHVASEKAEAEFYDAFVQDLLANPSFVEEEDEEGNKWIKFLDEDLEYSEEDLPNEDEIVAEVLMLKQQYKEFAQLPPLESFISVGEKNNMSREEVLAKYIAAVESIKKELNLL